MFKNKKDILLLYTSIAVFSASMLFGYFSGNFLKLFHHKTLKEKSDIEQQAFDHIFGSDRSFEPSGDNINTIAKGNNDTISWKTLSHAQIIENNQVTIEFGDDIKKLNGKDISITGYIFPLEASKKQSHFLLSAYSPTCPYCLPAGPTELIEVVNYKPIDFSYKPVTITGKFHTLDIEAVKEGMYYQIGKD